MKTTVAIESLRGPAGEFLLASVTGGDGLIGICDTSVKNGVTRKTLYAGNESLIDIQYRENSDESNRIIWQTSSIDKTKSILGTRLPKACDNYFSGAAPLSKAILPILELLSNGLYVVHVARVYPTDGAGNFFWDSFTIKHEIFGSAPHNPVIGNEKCYSPPFLVPTQSFSGYTESAVGAAAEKLVSGKKIGGIAYHLTGMFSALLEGHINAAACVANGYDFNCIIIEPLNRVIYGTPGEINEKKAIALSCPFVKLSFEELSRSMLENFLINRSVFIPKEFEEIKFKVEKPKSTKGPRPKKVSRAIELTSEGLPDAEMMYSAYAIDELTDDEIQALLNGSTEIDGRVIISQNFYESLTYAANYLQFRSKRKFIDFAQAILINHDLSPAYVYIAGRLKYMMDAKVNEIFKNVAESDDPIYAPIKTVAENYLKAYSEFSEVNVKKFLSGSLGPSPGQQREPRSAADVLLEFAENKRTGGSSGGSGGNDRGELSSLELAKQIEKMK